MRTETEKRQPQLGREFWLYFAVIYAVVLPAALLQWLARLVVPGDPDEQPRSVFGAAYAMAWRITPQIFSV